ncbi:ankyrin repeat domain-containing protein [Aspergillus saccharolyticus JOP 1030-1]|uniref:Ankyrin n=1 Tax=Aspergillus saccharolyticus JOP 1030-1 TaxID=1450539 RepID=A0A318ZIT9_9EURO|nr:ankyrin [Aspergillus saccharolyticus JOP 1030-1]PYH47486.1 ankyrin [Aspergillus saccharolyticus JOP 1030-1]
MAERMASNGATPKRTVFLSIPPELHLQILELLDVTSLVHLGLALGKGHDLIHNEIQNRAKIEALPSQEMYDRRMSLREISRPEADWRKFFREPLAEAVCTGQYEIVRFFLEARVSANSINLDAVPMLHLSIRECQYHVTELLLQYGADSNVVCATTGQMALDYAVGGPNVPPTQLLELLLNAGARFIHDFTFSICCTQTWGTAFFRLAVKNGTEILPETTDWYPRLQAAYRLASMEMLDCLFDLAPKILTARHHGRSALDMALALGREDVAVSLVRRGIPLQDSAEKQIVKAMQYGQTKLVRELLDHAHVIEKCPQWKCAAIPELSETYKRKAPVMTCSRQHWLKMIS